MKIDMAIDIIATIALTQVAYVSNRALLKEELHRLIYLMRIVRYRFTAWCAFLYRNLLSVPNFCIATSRLAPLHITSSELPSTNIQPATVDI